jgi:two-component system chemotaxis response regulator CheY
MAQSSQASEQIALGAPGRVLLVDDQPELRRLFRRSLNRAGHVVVEAWNGRVAVEMSQKFVFDVVISDVRMPDMSGIDLLRAIYEQDPDLPVVLTSGSPDHLTPLEADDLGAFAYLIKPVSFEMMHATANHAIDLRRARAAAKELFEPYESMERLRVRRPHDDDRG